jgi:hypothetical protein
LKNIIKKVNKKTGKRLYKKAAKKTCFCLFEGEFHPSHFITSE